MSRALILTHPHRSYDHGRLDEEFQDYVQNFDGDSFVVPSVKDDRCEMPYLGSEDVDGILEEYAYGKLSQDDVNFIAENYESVVLAGGYLRECLSNTHSSLVEENVSTEIEPKISYDQNALGKVFTLEEIISTKNRSIIKQFLSPFEDGKTQLSQNQNI